MKTIGYTATIFYKDEPETEVSGLIIKIGDADYSKDAQIRDNDVIWYIDSEEEINHLTTKNGSCDFVVVSYEPIFEQIIN